MKNMNKIIAFGTGILLALLAGCTDLNDKSSASENSKYTVNGKISLGASGAAPSALLSKSTSARTATSSFSDDITWEITAKAKDGDKTYSPASFADDAFSFLVDEVGEYSIEATAKKDGKKIAYTTATATVDESGTGSVDVVAKPVASTVLGKVNLPMSFDSTAASKISSVKVHWIGLEDRAMATRVALGYDQEAAAQPDYTVPEEVEAAIEALDEWQELHSDGALDKTFPVSGGKATVSIDDIFCGAHSVKFNFNDSNGNTIYSCTEMVNVYSGFTTDAWYGSAPHIEDETFNLTWKAIASYGVAKDNTILYSSTDGYRNTNGDLILTADSTTFDFDSLGCVWAFTNWGTTDVEIVTDSLVRSENLQVSTIEMKMLSELKIDRSNDVLYTCFTESGQENILILTKYDNLIKEGNTETSTKYEITFSGYDNFKCQNVAIHGNIVYVVGVNDGGDTKEYYLMTADLSNADSSNHVGTTETDLDLALNLNIKLSELYDGYYSNPRIEGIYFTDMLYQDGALYLLLRDYDYTSYMDDKPSNYGNFGIVKSRGALIKVDLSNDNAITTIGWTKDPISNTGKKFYAYSTSKEHLYTGYPYNEQNYATLSLPIGDYPEPRFYVPYGSTASSSFYGPQKFIAIKPKKLVIADDGIAFYTDSNGAYNVRNSNRVVTVDLENFAVTSEDVDCDFDTALSRNIVTSGYCQLNEAGYSDSTCFYQSSGIEYEKSWQCSIGIPLGK